MVSMTTTADIKCTTPMITLVTQQTQRNIILDDSILHESQGTKDQKRSRVHSRTPLTSIQSLAMFQGFSQKYGELWTKGQYWEGQWELPIS